MCHCNYCGLCLKYGLDGENEWQRPPYRGVVVRMIEGDLLPALVMGRKKDVVYTQTSLFEPSICFSSSGSIRSAQRAQGLVSDLL